MFYHALSDNNLTVRFQKLIVKKSKKISKCVHFEPPIYIYISQILTVMTAVPKAKDFNIKYYYVDLKLCSMIDMLYFVLFHEVFYDIGTACIVL